MMYEEARNVFKESQEFNGPADCDTIYLSRDQSTRGGTTHNPSGSKQGEA